MLANDTDSTAAPKTIASATSRPTAPWSSPATAAASPTSPTRTTATTAPLDRHLHLHAERRLDGDGLGRRSPASTTPRSRSTTPRPSPRTPARPTSTCSPTTPTSTAGRRRSRRPPQPANGTVVVAADSWRAHLHARRQLLQRGPPTTPSPTRSTAARQATVSVTVTCVDDAPVAVDDAATVAEDAGDDAIDVLANDTDIDGGPKTIARRPAAPTAPWSSPPTAPASPTRPMPTTATRRPPTTPSPTRSTAARGDRLGDGHLRRRPPVAVDDAATVAEDAGATTRRRARQRHRHRRRAEDDRSRRRSRPTAPWSSPATAPVTYKPDPELLQRGAADRHLHLHAERRLDGDRLGDRQLRRRRPAAVDDSRPWPRTPAPTAIDVLANDTDIDGGPKTITVGHRARPTAPWWSPADGSGLTYTARRQLLQRRPADRHLHLHR